ncbi:hypothetical protein RCH09_003568 [Actimicrobium sp. GrIS 1.19]|uniref:O-antigen ligase family protein n=1 Tax=Actimicrobium sp. GrIS 1.19 TaxID=3071708 RepID=UPI002E023042|nr:hypothetical protein [Actimicrobium sp. GrIS 1.19]
MEIISYILMGAPYLFMALCGVLVPALLVLCYSRFWIGLVMVCSIFIIDTLTLGEGGFNLGINFYYADIFLGLLSVAAGLRLVFAVDFPNRYWPWLAFCGLILVSLGTGLISFGSIAGVQARAYFYFMAASLYAMSFTMTEARLRQIFSAFAISAFLLIGIAIYRWIVYYTPIPSLLPPGGSYNVDGAIRVIYSYSALVLAQVLIGGVFFAAASPGFTIARLFSPFLLAAVLALQHRSVWLAAIVGILVRLLLGNSKSGSTSSQLILLVSIAAVTAVPLAFNSSLSGVSEQVGSSASRAFSGSGTGGERLQSWGEIVKNWYGAGVRSIVIGQSFGTDNSRYVKDGQGLTRKINYVAHNLYVQTLFNTGLLGLLAYLAANWFVISGLYKLSRDGRGGIEAEVLLVLMAMQLTYYIPYGVDYLQGFLFGAALAYVAGKNSLPLIFEHPQPT